PTTSITDPTSHPAARPSTIVVAEPSHPGIGSAVQAEATVRVTAPTSRSPADTLPVPIASHPAAEAITTAPVTTPETDSTTRGRPSRRRSSRTNAATTPSPTTTATYSRSSQSRRLAMAAPPINARTTTAPPRAGSPSSVGQPSANRKAMPATVSTSRYRSPKAVIPSPAAAVAVTTARKVLLISVGLALLLDRGVLPMGAAAVGAPCPGQGTGPGGWAGAFAREGREFGAGGESGR